MLSPDGKATGMVKTGRPPMLAGVVSVRILSRFARVQSALVRAAKGDAGRIRKSNVRKYCLKAFRIVAVACWAVLRCAVVRLCTRLRRCQTPGS